MSDEQPAAKKPRTTKSTAAGNDSAPASESTAADTPEVVEVVESTEVVDTTDSDGNPVEVEVTEVAVTEREPVAATTAPDDVVTSVPRPQVIYVTAPPAPRPAGNRGFGALIALAATLLYGVLLAAGGGLLSLVVNGRFDIGFVTRPLFYAPIVAFLVAFVLLVVIVNRAAWWSYILGSIFVGLFVYFGTIGVGMLTSGVILESAEGTRNLFLANLASPFVIISALLAREVAMWVGAGIAARGRRVKARNASAREEYERELERKRAEHERGAATAV